MLSEKKERINKKKQFYRSKKKNDIKKRNQNKTLRKQTTNYAIDKQRTQKASKIRARRKPNFTEPKTFRSLTA